MKALIIASGGMDSATAAYKAKAEGQAVTLVGFDYGQRHRKELAALKRIGEALGADTIEIALPFGSFLPSSLTDPTRAVPHGHYADETMKATVVPNRNAIFIAVACGLAQAIGAEEVWTGVHAGDHPIYPDCRPEFVEPMREAMLASSGVRLVAPFLHMTKADIVAAGAALGVPLDLTWSCYEGGDVHCGECGTCVERKEAFLLAGVPDPTEYAR